VRAARQDGAARIASCLGFEASVLRRLTFGSVAVPFCGAPNLAWYLKLWRKGVITNDLSRWSWWSSRALVENATERLTDERVREILPPSDLPREVANEALLRRLTPEDAVWFEALRARVDAIENVTESALAVRAALLTLDYAAGFTPATAHLRRPLDAAFDALRLADRPPVDAGARCRAANLDGLEFVGKARADLLFVDFPGPRGVVAWRDGSRGLWETWLRGSEEFFDAAERERRNAFGGPFTSKARYADAVDEFLKASVHFPQWAILLRGEGWLTLRETLDLVERHRPVRVAYTKDLTEVPGGGRHHMVVAG
jgi:hypothetical protein